ncbi:hypothetical protein G7Z17_g6861 [Cylindrodendrum hubeiense]|uniref:Uncharacterized protein n=1 Tax=Cylindrodendrum hubeiense TaxID=595255 RepID=A0A9P5H913_9HYPO|nr:hypothetical protein G7Z17_g6861 [Cylindrodendrum hubeiense]
MTTPEPVSKFNDVKNVVAEYKRRFDAIKSPGDVYRDKRANVKAEIAQVWAYMAAKADPSDMTGVQSIVDLGGHLKELEYMHEATINRNQNAYEEKLKAVVGSLCDDLVIALGPSMVTKSLQKLSKEQPGPVSPDISSTNGPEKPAPVLQESAPPDGQPAAHIDGPAPTPNKGPQDDLEDSSKSRKRRRIAENQPGEAEQRNSHPRAAAVQTPIAKATKRTGQANSKLVKDQIPSSTTETTGVQTRRSRARPGQEDSETVNEPTPGNIYFAFRNKSKEWSAALLLPKTDLEEVGVPGTLDSLGLMDDMPACYSYNKDTDTFRWRKGYRDGQSLVKQRQFPVMFFDGRAFPEKTEVGWSVFKYLKERAALAAEEEEEEEEEEDRESMLVDDSGVDSVDEDQGQRAPSIAPTLQGDRDHSPPKESGESATQIPPNTAVLSNPAPSLGDIQKAHPSPKLGPATAMNGQIDMAPEVISISSSPAEGRSPTNQHFPIPDRLRGLPDSHNPQGSSIATDRPKGTGEENLYLIQKRGMEETSRQTAPTAMQQTNAPRTRYNAEELMRDSQSVPFEKVQYNAADMMFIPPEMASLARDALDTVYQSESRPEEELPTTVDQQATPPVPGALLATMSVWSNLAQSAPGPLSPESSRSQNGLPANHRTQSPKSNPGQSRLCRSSSYFGDTSGGVSFTTDCFLSKAR